MASQIITGQQLSNIASAQQPNSGVVLTAQEKEYNLFLQESNNKEFGSNSLTDKTRQFLNLLFLSHCTRPCTMNSSSQQCYIHWLRNFICLYGHFHHETDPLRCSYCYNVIRPENIRSHREKWNSLPKENKNVFIQHFTTCRGCWRCSPINFTSDHIFGSTHPSALSFLQVANRDTREDSRMNEVQDVEVPRSLFYSRETDDKQEHVGYLRIIPVNLENDTDNCEDYKEFVKQMQEDSSYQQRRRIEIGGMDEKENRMKATIIDSDIVELLQRQRVLRGVEVKGECLERISIALKEYLDYLLRCCKKEHMNSGEIGDEEHITVVEVTRAIRHNPWLISPSSSLL